MMLTRKGIEPQSKIRVQFQKLTQNLMWLSNDYYFISLGIIDKEFFIFSYPYLSIIVLYNPFFEIIKAVLSNPASLWTNDFL